MDHRESGGAVASSRGAVTHASVHTQTRLHAAVAVETVRTRLVAEQTRPARLAGAFAFHRMAATEGQNSSKVGRFLQPLQEVKGRCWVTFDPLTQINLLLSI